MSYCSKYISILGKVRRKILILDYLEKLRVHRTESWNRGQVTTAAHMSMLLQHIFSKLLIVSLPCSLGSSAARGQDHRLPPPTHLEPCAMSRHSTEPPLKGLVQPLEGALSIMPIFFAKTQK